METIEISKTAYDRLMSKRVGREAISTVILREIQPIQTKSKALEELEKIRKGKFYTLDEAEKKFNI